MKYKRLCNVEGKQELDTEGVTPSVVTPSVTLCMEILLAWTYVGMEAVELMFADGES